MGPIQNFDELLAMLRRRAPMMALIIVLGALATLAYALNQSPVYQARALIQLQGPMIADQTAAQPSPARRLQQIEQRITTRDTMLELAERFDLYVANTPSERADLMLGSITLRSVAAPQESVMRDGAISSIMIFARAGDARTAAALSNALAERIMQLGAQTRSGRVQEQLSFFRSEEQRLTEELVALEGRLEQFKIDNFDLLPANLAARVQELFERENDLRALRREIGAISAEIAELEPDAQRTTTQRRLAQLRDQREALRGREQELQDVVGELDPMLRSMPLIERELAVMEREQSQLRDRLLATSERRSQAELAARIEDDQQAERFELLEAAVIPDYPISRSKRNTAMMGGVAVVGLAVVLAFVLEILNPVLRTPTQLERALGMRPVLTIPELQTPAQRRRRGIAWLSGLALAVLAALAMLIQLRQG